jgi:protein-tyrosine-phosphatase
MPFRVLFVCTGNTCRSPLAEAIARGFVEREGEGGFEFSSAGIQAREGGLASPGALEIARENGLDLEGFQSRSLTADRIDEADLVLVMEPGHRSGVLGLSPAADTKTRLLGALAGREGSEASVADPLGGNVDSYRRTFAKIEALFREGIPRILEMAAGDADHS